MSKNKSKGKSKEPPKTLEEYIEKETKEAQKAKEENK